MITEFKNEFDWLSNFTPVNIELDGIVYSSVEHAFMSAKSHDMEWKYFCANPVNSAGKVKKEGRSVNLIDNWEQLKLVVMRTCLERKFNTEPFKTKLLETKDENLEEGNHWNDKFWGVCLKTNEGENHLGKLIMSVRSDLQGTKTEPCVKCGEEKEIRGVSGCCDDCRPINR
jgi:ribA/ribD-fused uncharacterized protein